MPALARRAEYGWWATANWVDSCHGCLCQYAWVFNEQTNWSRHRRERMFPQLYSRSVYFSVCLFSPFSHQKWLHILLMCLSSSTPSWYIFRDLLGCCLVLLLWSIWCFYLIKCSNSSTPFHSSLTDRPCVCCVLAKWRVAVPLCFCAGGLELDTRRYRAYSHGLVVNLRPHWYSIVKPISLVDVSGRAKNPLLFLWVFSRGMKVCERGRCFVIRVVLRASRVVRQ